jgi:hypothetical protein
MFALASRMALDVAAIESTSSAQQGLAYLADDSWPEPDPQRLREQGLAPSRPPRARARRAASITTP